MPNSKLSGYGRGGRLQDPKDDKAVFEVAGIWRTKQRGYNRVYAQALIGPRQLRRVYPKERNRVKVFKAKS